MTMLEGFMFGWDPQSDVNVPGRQGISRKRERRPVCATAHLFLGKQLMLVRLLPTP